MLETIKPMDIEKRSFEIITELLGERKLDPENEPVIKRVIHTSADFDYVTTYENSRRSKPNPAYYQDILTRTGKRPEECMMIGNSPSEDMAAQALGLSVCLVTDYLENPGDLPINAYPHGSFQELAAYLNALPKL